MQLMNRFKLGGNLLAAGAGLALLTKAYWLFVSESSLSMGYRVVGSIIGSWVAQLVIPQTIGGTTLEFSWTSLLWLPWAAVFIAFLLWVAKKVIQGQFKSDPVLLPVLGILGAWFLVGLLYDRISNDFYYFAFELKWLLPELLSDLAIIAMIVGIGLILFYHKEAMTGAADKAPWRGEMTLSHMLFSFKGRICRAEIWLYQVLILNLVFGACIAIGALVGDIDGTEVGYAIGLLLTLWPGLALAVKRCHDRNRSGAFVLVSLIPFVGLWYLVEVLFLKGTEGDNKYGPDPLLRNPSGRKDGIREKADG